MDVARERSELRDGRFDGLHAEAKAALAYAGNTLRGVRDRYRESYREELGRWQALRDELDRIERAAAPPVDRNGQVPHPAEHAERRASDQGQVDIRAEVDRLNVDIGRYESELNRLEIAQ